MGFLSFISGPQQAAPVAREPLHLADWRASYGNVPSLDGLRAISILLVLLAHFVNNKVFPGGLGVLIFFVISGFLITRLLIAEYKKTGENSLAKFYLRRVFRLYPAVLLCCLIVSAWMIAFLPEQFDPIKPISALFYFANYLDLVRGPVADQTTTPFGIFWSLSIEEQYYAFFPMLFLWARKSPKRLFFVGFAATIVPLLIRIAYVTVWPEMLQPGGGHLMTYSHTETRIDSIAFGVMIAAACELELGRRIISYIIKPIPVVLALALIVLCLVFRDPFFRETFRYTFLQLGSAVLLCAFTLSGRYWPVNLVLNSPPFEWVGKLSYSIYVWHKCAMMWGLALLAGFPHWIQISAFIALTGVIASASYYGPEAAARRLRERLQLR